MATAVSVLGGVGLFLLGMSVMTGGLKALAGSRLRETLGKLAATPLSGTFWGAFVTLIVQSSSATTMTTIDLVSAGLLTFSQGLGLVFGANVGTTGNRLARCAHRCSRLAYSRGITDDLRRRLDQAVGPWTRVGGRCRACRVCPCVVWIDDPAAGDGRPGRTVAPNGPSRCVWPKRQLGRELVRRAGLGRD